MANSPTATLDHSTPQPPPKINPLLFVPVLYFMQSVPNILVTESFTGIYKSLGRDNTEIAIWTSIIALPWAFKLFWGPLIDLTLTKRLWTLLMEGLIFVLIVACALAMLTPGYWHISLITLFLIAICSATHDIACDGLYLMSLDRAKQAAFSGFMAMASRIGRLFATFGVVWFGGQLIDQTSLSKGLCWTIALSFAALVYGSGFVWNIRALPRPDGDKPRESVEGELGFTVLSTVLVLAFGVALYFLCANGLELAGKAIYELARPSSGASVVAGAASLPATQASATESPLPPLPVKWDMTSNEIQTAAWIAGGCLLALLPLAYVSYRQLKGSAMGNAFGSYFSQQGFFWILTFIIFYRFGEAMIFKMVMPFLLDPIDKGGMGLSTAEAAQVHGVGGPLGLIIGGLLGGWFIAKVGIRKAFWPLVVCMHTPNLLYVLVAYEHPGIIWLYPVAFIEAFGYGFGFAGYFVYLMWVAQRGNFTTSHYAIGTGLGALFITFAGIAAGVLQSVFGWLGFFIAACAFTIPGTLTLLFIPLEPGGGKGMKAASDH